MINADAALCLRSEESGLSLKRIKTIALATTPITSAGMGFTATARRAMGRCRLALGRPLGSDPGPPWAAPLRLCVSQDLWLCASHEAAPLCRRGVYGYAAPAVYQGYGAPGIYDAQRRGVLRHTFFYRAPPVYGAAGGHWAATFMATAAAVCLHLDSAAAACLVLDSARYGDRLQLFETSGARLCRAGPVVIVVNAPPAIEHQAHATPVTRILSGTNLRISPMAAARRSTRPNSPAPKVRV